MAIDLREFASGDTDYIAKMNANVATLEGAITSLQVQMGAVAPGSALSAGMFLDILFNHADGLIGAGSYKPTLSATTATIAPGGMYRTEGQLVVQSFANVPLSFVGQPAGTHYITVDSAGAPARLSTQEAGAVYAVYWNGTAFSGTPTKLVPVFYDTAEAEASRVSTALAHTDTTLDGRIEYGETQIAAAQDAADEALDVANAAMDAVQILEGEMGLAAVFSIRKVGCTVDGSTGVKGAIQVDFKGTIIGWSLIADAVGSLSVEVSKKASSAPPAVPAIPNPTTDKISASAPIALSSAQSASCAAAGVSTWNTAVDHWDVIQFNVASVTTITRATLYLRIQETPPDVAVSLAFIASTAQTGMDILFPYGPHTIAIS